MMFRNILLKFVSRSMARTALHHRKQAIEAMKSTAKKPARKALAIFAALFCIITYNNSYADNTNYILNARQKNLLKNMDRIADMAANVNTSGFKAEKDIFTESPKRTSIKEKISFSNIGNTVRDDSQGNMSVTGRPLDVAINGKGFFMVNTPFGQMFTRSGSFMVSREGTLVSQDGYPIAGPSGGQVEFTEKDVDISIKEDGSVSSGKEERGQIGVFVFDNDALLRRVGKGLYKASQSPKVSEDYKIAQGVLESSNVNSMTAMTDLVANSRDIETINKITAAHNDLQLDMIHKMTQ